MAHDEYVTADHQAEDHTGLTGIQDAQGLITAHASTTHIPAGGTTGQVLVKLSDNDYDVGWTTL